MDTNKGFHGLGRKVTKRLNYALIFLFLFPFMCTSANAFASSSALPFGGTTPLEEEHEPLSITVAFDPHLPPFQFWDGEKYTGFNLAIMEAVAQSQGLHVKYRPMSLKESIAAIKTGEIDVILGVNFSAQLFEHMDFSEHYFSSSIGILVKRNNRQINNISDLSYSVVALERDTIEYDFLRNIREIHYHVASNQVNALRILFKGRADAFVGSRVTAEYILKQTGLDDQYEFVENYLLPLEYSFAVQKENHRLVHILNTGLRQIKLDGTYHQIYNDWLADHELQLAEQLRTVIKVFIFLFIIGAILFYLSIKWNRQLKHEVDKKTRDLQKANQSLEYQVLQTRNSDQFKEQILDSSPRGIVTCDRDGLITSYNLIAMKLTKLKEKPLGEKIFKIPMLAKMLTGKMEQVLEEGKQFLGAEMVISGDDEDICLRYYVYPLYDIEKKINGIILSFEDITEERRLREQIQEQEKSRALIQLVAGIAHEIRNPLTSIKTFVELIPSKMSNEKFQKEITTHVPKEIERLNQLVESLINYAKPKSREKKVVDVEQLIQSCLVLFEQTIKQKGFRLEKELEAGCYIEVDENQLKQVLINLILNGLEAMEEKQAKAGNVYQTLTLGITLYSTAKEVWIEIKDEGQGMSSDQVKKVLEPFYTTKAKGSGLGLALVNQYVNENDGQLFLESRLNEGTKIQLCFQKKVMESGQNINH